jgi:hypothetical protein
MSSITSVTWHWYFLNLAALSLEPLVGGGESFSQLLPVSRRLLHMSPSLYFHFVYATGCTAD